MKKLTKQEFDAVLDILIRLDKETDMCKHESLIWLQAEIYKILQFAEKEAKKDLN